MDNRYANANEPCDPNSFASGIGMLLYLSHSRPDILYATSVLCTKTQNPTMKDFRALKRSLKRKYVTLVTYSVQKILAEPFDPHTR